MVVNAIQLSTYDQIKHTLLNMGLAKEGMGLHFLASNCAGILMACASAPFDLAKTRVMAQPTDPKKRIYKGMFDAIFKTVKNEGAMALYKGFTPQWLRFGPYTVIMLMSWEYLRKISGIDAI